MARPSDHSGKARTLKTWRIGNWRNSCLGLTLAAALVQPVQGADAPAPVAVAAASTAPAASMPITVPVPKALSDEDRARYERIFALVNAANWKAVDAEVAKLTDKSLMGHVLYGKLMHPTGYRSSYADLSGWLDKYPDHPNAWLIYKLAKRRQGKAKPPRLPVDPQYPNVTGHTGGKGLPVPKRSKASSREVAQLKSQVRTFVKSGQPERAEKIFWITDDKKVMAGHERAALLERIAASYYYQGEDKRAKFMAGLAAKTDRKNEPTADWTAGLASWRLGDYESAYKHFAEMKGSSKRLSSWLAAGGRFWAARAAYRTGRDDKAEEFLRSAALEYPETFYGLLAARQLGIQPKFDWSLPPLTAKGLENLNRFPSTHRALALRELGRDDLADEELRLLWGRQGTAVQDDLLALTAQINLPNLQMRLSRAGGGKVKVPTGARFPLPDWEPVDGFRIDRALIYAMVRQESDFRIQAQSYAGARGLMQVMPATASYLTRDKTLFKRNQHRLYEPEFNIAVGQYYVEYLHDNDVVGGDLLKLLAAYNGGPGTLKRWMGDIRFQNDPLLFIESLTFHQTRDYIEKVMANLWMYRMKMGQTTASLDALAAGEWPRLEHFDEDVQVARANGDARPPATRQLGRDAK